jgi:hypothetical protein
MEVRKLITWLLCLLILLPVVGGCAKHKTTREVAFNFSVLETDLRRGTSTTDDVRRLIGEPNGSGGMLLPTDPEPRTVWFYEKFEVTAEGKQIDVKQDVLLIFFQGDRFDGYWWFSDAAKD